MAKNTNRVSVGGQALMEGVMMQGPGYWCMAVRTPDGSITTERHENKPRPWAKWPIVRGVCSFVTSMLMGYQTLMHSAELSMGDAFDAEPESKFDAWVENHFGDKAGKILMWVSALLGVGLALGLFIALPTFLVGLLGRFVPLEGIRSLLEGICKMAIFICYLALVNKMPDIRRTFGYHGAEHKTIACFEAGEELTVENVRGHTRYHARCSTSFIFIVLIISILVNSIIPASGSIVRILAKLALLPLVMGISFEVLRFTGLYDNTLTRILSYPGKWVQRLTTNEPDDSMIEVAIAAVKPVLPGYVEPQPEPETIVPEQEETGLLPPRAAAAPELPVPSSSEGESEALEVPPPQQAEPASVPFTAAALSLEEPT